MPYYSVFAVVRLLQCGADDLNGEIIIAIFSGTLLCCFISGKKDETPPLETAKHSDPLVKKKVFWQLYPEMQRDNVQKCVYLEDKQLSASRK